MGDGSKIGADGDIYPHIYVSDTDLSFPDYQTTGYGRYSDFKPLSRGGTAVLQTCRDKNLGRVVVIKTLLPHLADNEVMQARFLREARVTAQLAHPATVPVYDMGYDLERRLYFTMKKLEGVTMRKILDSQKAGDEKMIDEFNLDRLLATLIQVCNCLGYAHVHGVVHRDVKPENVLIGPFGETMVLDWGVAKVWAMKESHEQSGVIDHEVLTQVDQRPGTPLYMAPEQVRGGGDDIDARTDVYGAAAVLYEILTLEEPLRGKHIGETFDMILKTPPVPPRQRAPGRNIPQQLAEVCMKGLAKDPAKRYETMGQMVDALHEFRGRALEAMF
jgi:serine/threonine-protein kinase